MGELPIVVIANSYFSTYIQVGIVLKIKFTFAQLSSFYALELSADNLDDKKWL